MSQCNQKTSLGFTLIELMIAVAIVGILYTIALPSYNGFIAKGHRVEAQQEMLQIVSILERQYSRNGGYPDDFVTPTSDFYTYTYTPNAFESGATSFNSTSFRLEATAQGNQVNDECGDLSITSAGVLAADGGSDCWSS